jgi:radical SAM superfamily enzyme YgiQ (UPF0313 family)
MPLGILYVAAVLEQQGHEVAVLDGDIDQVGPLETVDYVNRWKPDLVGVSAHTPTYSVARRILVRLKKECPGAITVLGGYHLTALPHQTMAECDADLGVYGEGEQTIVELVAALECGKGLEAVNGILYRLDGTVHITPPRAPIEDLDTLPFPARHLLRYPQYVWSVPGRGLMPVTTVVTQRGCPFRCVFCAVRMMFPKVRYRRPERVVDELEHIVEELGIRHVQFSDDTLTLKADKVVAMCDEIQRRNLEFTWEGYTRADLISKGLLKRMKEAGLVRISFGLESGDQRILDAIRKDTTLEQYRQAYAWCNELGLETRCSLMLGNPFETRETVKRTVDFACSLDVYQAYINIATPYPGTALLDMARNGHGGLRLLTEDWSEYRRYGNAVMEMNDLTRQDLIRLQRKAYLRFYVRPGVVWKNIRRAGWRAAINNAVAFAMSVFKPLGRG